MRNTILGAMGAAILVVGLVPAVAAAKTTRVDGDHFQASGLRMVVDSCTVGPGEEATTRPAFRVEKGPGEVPLGSRAVGWKPEGTVDGVGPEVRVTKPSAMTRFRLKLYSRRASALGNARVRYFPAGNAGYWEGIARLPSGSKRGWRTVNASSLTYSWFHYTDGEYDANGGAADLATFVESQGGDGDGAWLSILHGCDGNPFFIDALTVGGERSTRTFDFEGFRTSARLLVGGKSPARRTITFGRALELDGRLFQAVGDRRVSGRMTFQGKRLGTKGYQKISRDGTTRSRDAETRVRPARSTAYRVVYAGSDFNEADASNVFKLLVRVVVGAHLVDSTITRGQSFTVAGRVRPGKVTKIQLQRYVNGSWTTVKGGRTAKDGDYRIGTTPSSAGTSYWRIKALSGGGNVGNTSKGMTLTVRSSSGGGGSDDPPPPPDDPPPPEG